MSVKLALHLKATNKNTLSEFGHIKFFGSTVVCSFVSELTIFTSSF